MAYDVFLCHSYDNPELIETICTRLDCPEIACQALPTSLPPEIYPELLESYIVDWVRPARVLVVVFSRFGNTSREIKRALDTAAEFRVPVIVFRSDDAAPAEHLQPLLGTAQWIEATAPPMEPHIEVLLRAVTKILFPAKPTLGLRPPPLPAAKLPAPAPSQDSVAASIVPPTLIPGRPGGPISANSERTVLDAGTMASNPVVDVYQTMPASPVGSFTTSLAATATHKIPVTIPEPFFTRGTSGKLLRLVPVECIRGRPPLELYLKTGDDFTLGRSPDADLITAFFPRNEKNDLRSRRLSKIHARLALRDNQLWAFRKPGSTVQVGHQAVGDDPAGHKLREHDQLVLAEDFAVEIVFDITLQGTLRFTNGDAWTTGMIEYRQTLLGAVRFEPLNSAPAIRTSCWLFIDVGFGAARGGVITAGAELAPQQGVMMSIGGCFWILNLVGNGKVSIQDHALAANDIAPLSNGDSVWLGAVRYRADIA